MSEAANNIVSTLGPYVGSIAAGVLSAFGIRADHAKRISAIEDKLDKLSKDQSELEDRFEDRLKEVSRENRDSDQRNMDKLLEVREKLADISGAFKSIGG